MFSLTKKVDGLTVLLIDMQYGFLRYSEDCKIIPRQATVLDYCRQTQTPVIVVECNEKLLGSTICPLLHIVKTLPIYRCVKKPKDSAFSDPSLELFLEEFRTEKLLLMGVRADCCIYKTAKDAVERYQVFIHDSLIATYYSPSIEEEVKAWYRQHTQYNIETIS